MSASEGEKELYELIVGLNYSAYDQETLAEVGFALGNVDGVVDIQGTIVDTTEPFATVNIVTEGDFDPQEAVDAHDSIETCEKLAFGFE